MRVFLNDGSKKCPNEWRGDQYSGDQYMEVENSKAIINIDSEEAKRVKDLPISLYVNGQDNGRPFIEIVGAQIFHFDSRGRYLITQIEFESPKSVRITRWFSEEPRVYVEYDGIEFICFTSFSITTKLKCNIMV